jgi:hypothetical protein
MKTKFAFLLSLTVLLAACGSDIDVATEEEVNEYEDQEPVMLAWQGLVEAAEAKDCETLLTYMRNSLNVTGEVCPDIYEYFKDGAPVIDWSRTDWSTSGGKAKIYEKEGGSVTSFIHNEADDTWKTDEKFWE